MRTLARFLVPWTSMRTFAVVALAFTILSCGTSSSTDPGPAAAGAAGSVADASPEAEAGQGGAAGVGGNPDCQFTVQKAECNSCLHTTCGDLCATCSKMASCGALYTCMTDCTSYDCQKQCEAQYPDALLPLIDFLGKGGCVDQQCQGSCDLGLGGSGPDPFESARIQCVNRINELRTQVGSPPVTRDTKREPCADLQVRHDATTGVAYGHLPPCAELGQNECLPAQGSPATLVLSCLQTFFDEGSSSDRYKNITNPDYKSVACGFFNATDGNVWLLQNMY